MILIRLAKSATLACLTWWVVAGAPALAHAILIASQPKQDDIVTKEASHISLRYNSRIDHRRSRLTLSAPDAGPLVLAPDSSDPPDTMSATARLVPGKYVLHWQVLAVDGHITRGDIEFNVVDR